MKSNLQSIKSTNSKLKKPMKDRDKRKSPGNSEITNHNEKGSPTKESGSRLYAGIDGESLAIYAEQSAFEHLSDEISNTLTEDINYKLRYIINDALIKARLSGRNAISSDDLEETFENLNIDRVYGALSNPEWIPFGYQNLFFLNDREVNLVEIAENENVYQQSGDTIITRTWLPEQQNLNKLTNYFTTMCETVISNDIELRRFALKNISENRHIGPIIEWFYKFSYILLSKDITYDNLTIYALDLINTLENSLMCRINIDENFLKLLIRLLLQRLLKSTIIDEILKPMCLTLKILCYRIPLREFVLMKIQQKFTEIFNTHSLSVLTICNNFDIDAIRLIFLPNMNLFLTKIVQEKDPILIYSILELYNIMWKTHMIDSIVYNNFYEIFGDSVIVFQRNHYETATMTPARKDFNFVKIKVMLSKLRRRISYDSQKKSERIPIKIEQVFEMPQDGTKLYTKLQQQSSIKMNNSIKQDLIIGKTSLLLPVLKQKNSTSLRYCDHSLISYNL